MHVTGVSVSAVLFMVGTATWHCEEDCSRLVWYDVIVQEFLTNCRHMVTCVDSLWCMAR